MYYYLNNFLFFSILGFIYENIMHLITTGSLTNNPFYVPWMPIYGFGVIIMIFLTRLIFNNLKIKRWQKIILLFISVTVILTIIELIGGYLTEFIFHKSAEFFRSHTFLFRGNALFAHPCPPPFSVVSVLTSFFAFTRPPYCDLIRGSR